MVFELWRSLPLIPSNSFEMWPSHPMYMADSSHTPVAEWKKVSAVRFQDVAMTPQTVEGGIAVALMSIFFVVVVFCHWLCFLFFT